MEEKSRINTKFTFEELEFLAEWTSISIIPNFQMDELHLITIPIEVPLWLALTLKKRLNCAIQPPEWLQVENLQRIYDEEKESGNTSTFADVDPHYVEIAMVLLSCAYDNFESPELVRSLIEDIVRLRDLKVKDVMLNVEEAGPLIFRNISFLEINQMKPMVADYLNKLDKFSAISEKIRKDVEDEMDEEEDTRESKARRVG